MYIENDAPSFIFETIIYLKAKLSKTDDKSWVKKNVLFFSN